jgi:hypothetical protein
MNEGGVGCAPAEPRMVNKFKHSPAGGRKGIQQCAEDFTTLLLPPGRRQTRMTSTAGAALVASASRAARGQPRSTATWPSISWVRKDPSESLEERGVRPSSSP